ncbi:MAG: DUF3179 domain-containing protein [Anaerolineae bacterium]
MKYLRKHSDSIFLGAMILGMVIGAVMLWSQWRIVEQYWQTNFNIYSVNPSDVIASGMGRDRRIVPIDRPVFSSVADARERFNVYDPVIVIDHSGVERAYPLRILAFHEIVNDQIGEIPIAVTYCPLCNSPIVYRREVNGQVLRMGVSGNFYGNNFLMYDDLTESWWYQFTGEAIIGDFTGEMLDVVPSQVVGFYSFATRYPDGMVLVGDEGQPRINYNMTLFMDYEENQSPLLTHDNYDPRLGAMAQVLSTTVNGTPIAYPFDILREVGVVNDQINGANIVIFWQPGAIGALESLSNQRAEIGQAAAFGRDLDGVTLSFYSNDGRIFDEQTDSEWNIFGESIDGELQGKTLEAYQCFTHFWFAWSSAHPNTLVYQP